MVINTAALERGLNTAYTKAYNAIIAQKGNKGLMELATEIPSTKSEEKYGWLGDVPVVKEWVSEKTMGGLKSYTYTLENKDYYTGIRVYRNELEDDQYNMINPRIASLAMAVFNYKAMLISDLIINGTTGTAYDGVAFFSNASGSRVNDNLLAGTGTTLAQVKADIATARSAMMKFVSDTSEVMNMILDAVCIPPELEQTMLEVVKSATIPGTAAGGHTFNPAYEWIKMVVVDPRLSDANDWYGFATSMPLKPFIFQNRKNPTNVLDDTAVKSAGYYDYSAEIRGRAGYGFPAMACKVVNS
jgi:phage major head subunit gpT-like protein